MSLSVKVRLFLSRIFTVTVAMVTVGGNLAFIAPVPAPSDLVQPRLLATMKTKSSSTFYDYVTPFAPTGVVICLIGDANLNLDASLPFPDRVTSEAMVGCDTVITPGATQVFEFNAENSPKFQALADRFTNATDEPIMVFTQTVNDDLLPDGVGVGGGTCETIFGKHRSARYCNPRNLLTGYTIDFFRLTASNVVVTGSTGTVSFSVDIVWQIYGHP